MNTITIIVISFSAGSIVTSLLYRLNMKKTVDKYIKERITKFCDCKPARYSYEINNNLCSHCNKPLI